MRTGPYGDAFGARPDGLTLAALEAAPHGIDLGPLQPRLPDALRTPSGKIELAPEPLVEDVARLRASLDVPRGDGLVLVGRRQLRSNNSWMHNLPLLVKASRRCTLQVHPDDAERHGLVDGEQAELRSRTGVVTAQVEITDTVMPGRGQPAPRLGARRAGHRDAGSGCARGGEQQPGRRRAADRRAVGKRGPERDPG